MSSSTVDNFTILRFAHAFASGAGTETYIEDLDQAILAKNSWKIIRMYLSTEKVIDAPQRSTFDRGVLIKVPVHAEISSSVSDKNTRKVSIPLKERSRELFRDYVLYNHLLYNMIFKKIIRGRSIPKREMEAIDARSTASDLMDSYHIDLLVMHHVGGKDSAAIIEEALKRGIPYVVINHYSNDRFNHLSVREQTMKAAGIGGVSSVDVPRRLRKIFFNLADGIDTGFFDPETTKPAAGYGNAPIVLLPARITPTKGQADLIKAIALLQSRGIKVAAALAGRADSQAYLEELRGLAKQLGVEKSVLFLGELTVSELKRWYSAATVLGFPTYHHEGLPRTLLESQAMKVPPVSYISGGTPGAILDGKTGFLIRKGDISSLAMRMEELIRDEKKRKQMGEKGRAFVEEHYSLLALESRHVKFYLKALKK